MHAAKVALVSRAPPIVCQALPPVRLARFDEQTVAPRGCRSDAFVACTWAARCRLLN